MDTNNSTKNSSFRSPTLDQDLAQTLQQDWWLSTTVLPDPLGGSQKSVAVSDQTFNDSCCSTPTSTFNPWNASSLTHCFNVSSGNPDGELAQSILFWVEGILLGITGSFGIVGNILTCVVLFRISLNNVFNQLIVALAAVDSLFVALCLIEYTLKKGLKLITYTTPVYVNLWPIFIYPFHNITYSVSLFVTLAIAIERYVAICHPFLVQRSRSSAQRSTLGGFERHASRTGSKLISFRGGGGNASSVSQQHNSSGMLKKRTCHYLLPALIFSVLINIPKFFEFRTVDSGNNTMIKPTEMRLNFDYHMYYINWFRALITAFVPFLTLAILNGKIILKMHQNANLRLNRNYSSSQKREAKLARILVIIVFCFLFCNIGKLALNIYDLGSLHKIRECSKAGLQFLSPSWVIAMISLNHLFLVMNASANLILISATGTQFRTTLLVMMRLRHAVPSTGGGTLLQDLRGAQGQKARSFPNSGDHEPITFRKHQKRLSFTCKREDIANERNLPTVDRYVSSNQQSKPVGEQKGISSRRRWPKSSIPSRKEKPKSEDEILADYGLPMVESEETSITVNGRSATPIHSINIMVQSD